MSMSLPFKNGRTRYLLALGFAAMLALMLFLTWVGIDNMSAAQSRLDRIAGEHMEKLRIVTGMHDAARERTINLQKMILLPDVFDRYEQRDQFIAYAGQFVELRERLLAMPLTAEEGELLARQSRLTGVAVPLQERVAEYALTGRMSEAHRTLVEKAIPAQDEVLAFLQQLYTQQQQRADEAVADANRDYRLARLWMLVLSVTTLGLAGFIVLLVLRLNHRASRALREEKERAQVTLHSIGEAVIRTDRRGLIEYLNPVAERLTGWTGHEAAGRPLGEVLRILHDTTHQPVSDPVATTLSVGVVVTGAGDTVLITKQGREHAIELTAAPIRDEQGVVAGVVVAFRDVTEMRALARELAHQATHDSMTGLLNRREFERRVQQALDSARASGGAYALCYLDLDMFKTVNDTGGHLAGDELLKQISLQLRRRARKEDVLARVGGDEFALLLRDCPLETAGEIAEGICQALRDSRFLWEDRSYQVGASIGVVGIAADSGDLNDIFRAADVAARVAKEEGRDRIHVHQVGDLTVALRQREINWVQRIPEAIRDNGFVLHGQWIYPLARGRSLPPMCEVLVRLKEQGDVPPSAAFLSAAERYHLMPAVDRWVVQTVFAALRDFPGDNPTVFTINLSGQSLCDGEFLGFVLQALEDSGVPATRLCFEITETAAITHMSRAIRFIEALKETGCRFALDDFGSGLSSFSYLKNMPVDFLKIDGTFVRNAPGDATDLAMVNSINQMAHIMGIQTIAEYVETEAIRTALETLGVDYGQGMALGMPVPLTELLTARRRTSRRMPG
jgi:diguanylate cyclase (GGDEF)-like protein/PAS domain S-box-containing protein